MNEKERKAYIEALLNDKFMLEYDRPAKYWAFFPTPGNDENELGKLIVSTSSNFMENRQRLYYELIISDDLKETIIHIYDKDKNKMTDYLVYELGSNSNFWLDESNGQKWHFRRILPPMTFDTL